MAISAVLAMKRALAEARTGILGKDPKDWFMLSKLYPWRSKDIYIKRIGRDKMTAILFSSQMFGYIENRKLATKEKKFIFSNTV